MHWNMAYKWVNKLHTLGFVLLMVLLGACNSKNNSMAATESYQAPVFMHHTDANTIKVGVEALQSKMEHDVASTNPKEDSVFFNQQWLKIYAWYHPQKKQLVKISHGAYNDSGQLNGYFNYYFINDELWYSDQIYARYLFKEGQLMMWLNENWNNNLPSLKVKTARQVYLNEWIDDMLVALDE